MSNWPPLRNTVRRIHSSVKLCTKSWHYNSTSPLTKMYIQHWTMKSSGTPFYAHEEVQSKNTWCYLRLRLETWAAQFSSVLGILIVPSVTFPGISVTELHQRSLQSSTSRKTFPLGFTSLHEITQEDIVCIRSKHCWWFTFQATFRIIAVNAHHWDDCTDRVTKTPCTRAITCSECLHPDSSSCTTW